MKAVPLPKAIADKIQQAPADLLGDGFLPKLNSSSSRNGSRRLRPMRRKGRPSHHTHQSKDR
jgi:hypothetical protein